MPPSGMKFVVSVSILTASILATIWFTALQSFLPLIRSAWHPDLPQSGAKEVCHPSALADAALVKVLHDAAPIFGPYANVQSATSTWMSRYPDDTQLVHLNIPGVHDAATWNYSAVTQESLKHVTGLLSDADVDPTWFRCQDTSIVDMLDAGIRAFDLRYAQDVTKTTLVFWHGPALQSETATVEDVLLGFYQWLRDHSSETVFLSFQYEPNGAMGNSDNEWVQRQIHDILTSAAATQGLLQARNAFGTLGAARGKVILLKRFDLDLLPAKYDADLPGINFSPDKWTANSADITLVYNQSLGSSEEGVAYIEDYYMPITSYDSALEENIQVKFNATYDHLINAASDLHPDGLFWTFTSGTKVLNDPDAVTPRKMALGEGDLTGVNHRLRELLITMAGQRLGIVMFDFFEQPSDLVPLLLGLREP